MPKATNIKPIDIIPQYKNSGTWCNSSSFIDKIIGDILENTWIINEIKISVNPKLAIDKPFLLSFAILATK
jgi:hypothetical protein